MIELAERRLRIAIARDDFLNSGHSHAEVVTEIVAASWKRSSSAGVDSATSQAIYYHDLDVSSRLMRCSQPIISRLSDETADMPMSIALTDSKARILSRSDTDKTIGTMLDDVSLAPGFGYNEESVGTNGIGTVFESGQPMYLVGPEHFHERLQPFACAGSPIRDPFTGRIEGVLDITCLSEYSSPLMHSLVRSAAHDIERNLFVDSSQCQQALFETFVRLDARTRGAVMAIGGTVMMGNAMAQSLFDPAEQLTIHEHARYLMISQGRPTDQIELSSGKTVRIRGTRIVVGNDIAGIVFAVSIVSESAPPAYDLPVPEDRVVDLPTDKMDAIPTSAGDDGPVSTLSEGLSPLWKRAIDDITIGFSDRGALLVMGEAGTGKFSLAAEAYQRAYAGGHSHIFEASDIERDRCREAEKDLSATTGPALFIFKNIDRLSAEGVASLDAFLVAIAESDKPVYVVATVSETHPGSDLPFRVLLAHFRKSVSVPPLRHRIEDLPILVSRVLANLTEHRGVTVSPAAMRVICRYAWPRNVRQLEEALESALLRRPVGEIQLADLPGFCQSSARRQLSGMEAGERDMIVNALRDAGGNRVRAAESLGIARSSLYRKLKVYGITSV